MERIEEEEDERKNFEAWQDLVDYRESLEGEESSETSIDDVIYFDEPDLDSIDNSAIEIDYDGGYDSDIKFYEPEFGERRLEEIITLEQAEEARI
jgi:hypothetical protein